MAAAIPSSHPIDPSSSQMDIKHSLSSHSLPSSAGSPPAASPATATPVTATPANPAAGSPTARAAAGGGAAASAASAAAPLNAHSASNLQPVGAAAAAVMGSAANAAAAGLAAAKPAYQLVLDPADKPEKYGSAEALSKTHKDDMTTSSQIRKWLGDNWKKVALIALGVALLGLAFFCPFLAGAAILAAMTSSSALAPALVMGYVIGVAFGGLALGFGIGGFGKSEDEKQAAQRLQKMNDDLAKPTAPGAYNREINKRIRFYKPQAGNPPKTQEEWVRWKLRPEVYDNVKREIYRAKFKEVEELNKQLRSAANEDERKHILNLLTGMNKEVSELVGNASDQGGLDGSEVENFTLMGMVPKTADDIMNDPDDEDNAAIIAEARVSLESQLKNQSVAEQSILIRREIEKHLGGQYHRRQLETAAPQPPAAPVPPPPLPVSPLGPPPPSPSP